MIRLDLSVVAGVVISIVRNSKKVLDASSSGIGANRISQNRGMNVGNTAEWPAALTISSCSAEWKGRRSAADRTSVLRSVSGLDPPSKVAMDTDNSGAD